jgi:hypothetical protein
MLSFISEHLKKLDSDYRLIRRCFVNLHKFFILWNSQSTLNPYSHLLHPIIEYGIRFLKEKTKVMCIYDAVSMCEVLIFCFILFLIEK